jgi:hypothetical protein
MTVGYPVMRKAEFTEPKDPLSKTQAQKLASKLNDDGQENLTLYIEKLRKEYPAASIDIVEHENVRMHEEGNFAFIVDYPEILLHKDELLYSIRSTTAVCYKNSSTKNWTRVALKSGIDVSSAGYEIVVKDLDHIAQICCDLSQQIFIDLITKKLKTSAENIGEITVIAIGIKDDKLKKIFDQFDDTDLKLKDLFVHNKAAKAILSNYYKKLYRKYNIASPSTDQNYWISAQSDVTDINGYIVDSNVLFNVEISADGIKAYGLGHDLSKDGILANIASLKVAKIYAKEI